MPIPLRRLINGLGLLGVDPRRLAANTRAIPGFVRDLWEYRKQHDESAGEFPIARLLPCLGDHESEAGAAHGAYFHQDLLVAQWIYERRPERHVDVASRIDGFVAHVATFMPVEVIDIRPLSTKARNIRFRRADFMGDIGDLVESTSSLSCLHALEHFGLGRYGDTVDYYGYAKGWENLHRMLQPGGMFYFSVPVGRQQAEFNGQRVFSSAYVLELAEGKYHLEAFAYVDEAGELALDVDPRDVTEGRGCGIFRLRKRG